MLKCSAFLHPYPHPMPLHTVTFTGPDDRTDPADLARLARRYPFVEWAILWTPLRSGKARCPTDAWVAEFVRVCADVRKSIHLTDADVDLWLAGDPRILAKAAPFERAQLNFDQSRTPRDPDVLARGMARRAPVVILQQHEGNAFMIETMRQRGAPFEVLFDASSGKGVRPDAWPAPIPGVPCGYAGGLGPKTIAAELPRIDAAAAGPFWIDMASSVRDPADDSFSLSACEAVLAACEPFAVRRQGPLPDAPR
jgi:hypothetical protein